MTSASNSYGSHIDALIEWYGDMEPITGPDADMAHNDAIALVKVLKELRKCGPNDRNSIIEECAKVCDENAALQRKQMDWNRGNEMSMILSASEGRATWLAEAIRGLKRTHATNEPQEKP